jgi:hypothetical protein
MAKKTLKQTPTPKPAKPKKKAAKQASNAVASKAQTTPTELPSEAELRRVAGLPALSKKDVMKFHRAPAGFVGVAKNALKAWRETDARFGVAGISADDLAQALAEREALAPIERKLAVLAEQAYRHRVCADGRAIRLMLTMGRAVKAVRNTGLLQRFSELTAWIKATHSGPKKRAKKTDAAPPSES